MENPQNNKTFFILLTVIILFSSTGILFSQSNMHWQWVENDTVFNRSGISGIDPYSCVKFVDVNNDNKAELMLSNRSGMHLYQNLGDELNKDWRQQTNFFNGISPAGTDGFDFMDIDHDSIPELITAAEHFCIWENSGTIQNPNWEWDSLMYRITFVPELDIYYLKFPELVDFDGDGDFDIFGMHFGFDLYSPELMYYENVGKDSIPVWKADSTFFENFQQGYGLNYLSLVDFDGDGDFDLFFTSHIEDIIYMNGFLNISEGDSLKWEPFDFPIPYNDIIYNNLFSFNFYDYDHDDDFDFLLTNDTQSILYYENIGSPSSATFTEFPETWGELNAARKSCPLIFDFDSDNDFDIALFGIHFGFEYDYLVFHTYEQKNNSWIEMNLLPLDKNQDIVCKGVKLTAFMGDLNADQHEDIFISASYIPQKSLGDYYIFFRNTGNDSALVFEVDTNYLDTLAIFARDCRPIFGDLDGDTDLDLMVNESGHIHFFENSGNFEKYSISGREDWSSGDSIFSYCRAHFVDFDFDGDNDLVLGHEDGSFTCYFNIGTKHQPFWQRDLQVFSEVSVQVWASPYLIDFDDDGDVDLISGNGLGGIQYFENKSFTSVESEKPKLARTFRLFQNYPNPFNASTIIKYEISEPDDIAKLYIFNVRGERVRTLINSNQAQGIHAVHWDGKNDSGEDLSSGVYFCKLQTGERSETRKLVLVR